MLFPPIEKETWLGKAQSHFRAVGNCHGEGSEKHIIVFLKKEKKKIRMSVVLNVDTC